MLFSADSVTVQDPGDYTLAIELDSAGGEACAQQVDLARNTTSARDHIDAPDLGAIVDPDSALKFPLQGQEVGIDVVRAFTEFGSA